MEAFQRQFGQPHQLAQSEIAAILNAPDVRSGDTRGFQRFALNVDLRAGMLISLEGPHGTEIMSTGNVDRLLSKLPKHLRDSFVEHLQSKGCLHTTQFNPYSLRDLTRWLKDKAEAQRLSEKMVQRHRPNESTSRRECQVPTCKPRGQSTSVYHGSDISNAPDSHPAESSISSTNTQRAKRFCLFCRSTEHYLLQCTNIMQHSPEYVEKWLEHSKRCRKCGRTGHS